MADNEPFCPARLPGAAGRGIHGHRLMQLYFLGIGGTFMAAAALLARSLGHGVRGADEGLYPPTSVLLAEQGIAVDEGYRAEHLQPAPEMVVVGNALSRGNAAVEYMLNHDLPYCSAPQWLYSELLRGRRTLAVAGTHGKSTSAAMLAWILTQAGRDPGFLLGAVPRDGGVPARVGGGGAAEFVVEADEYDTAFFDKRAKFVHYRPRILLWNNLEYDHADIYPDIASLRRQFHHLVRTVPGNGCILAPWGDTEVEAVLQMGCWTPREYFVLEDEVRGLRSGGRGNAAAARWRARLLREDGGAFLLGDGEARHEVRWQHCGRHNVRNALGATAAAAQCGVAPDAAARALCAFPGLRRRMELCAEERGVRVYDDFAHHPSAIGATLEGLRAKVGKARILALIEPRSHTMRAGVHQGRLAACTECADRALWLQPKDLQWDLAAAVEAGQGRAEVFTETSALLAAALEELRPGDHVVLMSNGAFGGMRARLLAALGAGGGYKKAGGGHKDAAGAAASGGGSRA